MKKIFFTVTNDLNYDQRMIRICSSLAKHGFDVTLIGRIKKSSQIIVSQPFNQIRLSLFFEKGFLFYLEYNIRLFFILLKKADAICSIDLDTLPAGYWAARLSNKKIIFDAHEYYTESPEIVNRPKIQKFWQWIEKSFVHKVDGAYTVCKSLENLFSKKYNIPFQTIRNVPFESKNKTHLSKKNEQKILLYQGALNDGRGLKEMIEAMPYLHHCELWLAGEGDLSAFLREQSRKNKVEDRVKFLGMILPKDLPALTSKADIGLNLLENKGLNYYYSLANKTFDYIQAGVPAIHIDFPEYRLINEHFNIGVLVKDLGAESIIEQINSLIQDPDFYDELKRNCHKAAKELTWENEEKKLLDFYKTI